MDGQDIPLGTYLNLLYVKRDAGNTPCRKKFTDSKGVFCGIFTAVNTSIVIDTHQQQSALGICKSYDFPGYFVRMVSLSFEFQCEMFSLPGQTAQVLLVTENHERVPVAEGRLPAVRARRNGPAAGNGEALRSVGPGMEGRP